MQSSLIRRDGCSAVGELNGQRKLDFETSQAVLAVSFRTVVAERISAAGHFQVVQFGFAVHRDQFAVGRDDRQGEGQCRVRLVSAGAVVLVVTAAVVAAAVGLKPAAKRIFELVIGIHFQGSTIGKIDRYRKNQFVAAVFAHAAALLDREQGFVNGLFYRLCGIILIATNKSSNTHYHNQQESLTSVCT